MRYVLRTWGGVGRCYPSCEACCVLHKSTSLGLRPGFSFHSLWNHIFYSAGLLSAYLSTFCGKYLLIFYNFFLAYLLTFSDLLDLSLAYVLPFQHIKCHDHLKELRLEFLSDPEDRNACFATAEQRLSLLSHVPAIENEFSCWRNVMNSRTNIMFRLPGVKKHRKPLTGRRINRLPMVLSGTFVNYWIPGHTYIQIGNRMALMGNWIEKASQKLEDKGGSMSKQNTGLFGYLGHDCSLTYCNVFLCISCGQLQLHLDGSRLGAIFWAHWNLPDEIDLWQGKRRAWGSIFRKAPIWAFSWTPLVAASGLQNLNQVVNLTSWILRSKRDTPATGWNFQLCFFLFLFVGTFISPLELFDTWSLPDWLKWNSRAPTKWFCFLPVGFL